MGWGDCRILWKTQMILLTGLRSPLRSPSVPGPKQLQKINYSLLSPFSLLPFVVVREALGFSDIVKSLLSQR